jgi:pimeloyl-ACP methyl ester carboxylesterase
MIYFLHGNGFPSGCYRQFIQPLSVTTTVFAEPLLTSPIECPPKLRWLTMRDQAVARIETLITEQAGHIGKAGEGEKIHLVGHSMGGYLQMMAAQALIEKNPNLQKFIGAIVLIDSPVPLGWRGFLLKALQATSLSNKFGPAPIAAKRRFRWESIHEAIRFFATKPFTHRWYSGVLKDFTAHALSKTADGQFELTVPRQVESDIYAHTSAAQAVAALYALKNKGLSPYFIAGSESIEVGLAGRKKIYRLFQTRLTIIDGGHLIPFEQPKQCAQAVLDFLKQYEKGPKVQTYQL